jgi:hypothetical protein
MTITITRERIERAYALISQRVQANQRPPTNYEIAVHIGAGARKYAPAWTKPEAGSVLVRACEMMGLIEVDRIGRNRRVIRLTGELPVFHGNRK